MLKYSRVSSLLFVAGIATAFLITGCAKPPADPAPVSNTTTSPTAAMDHSGWWCPEHGVPEDVCTRCNSTLIAEFRTSGDWCDEHSRPDSQCFHCHPELQEKFAARYEAKYGKQPPVPTDL